MVITTIREIDKKKGRGIFRIVNIADNNFCKSELMALTSGKERE